MYQDDYRFVESLPGPSQFAEPHPDDAERFYSDLFEAGVAEGMRGFENVRRRCVLDLRANLSLTQTALLQDFMNYNLLAMPLFRQEHDASRRWLAGMNAAAIKHSKPSWAGDLCLNVSFPTATIMRAGLPVQMCMTLPSDLMASTELDSVTNYRASGDYAGNTNFDIGGSSLLGWALGLRPSKDVPKTSSSLFLSLKTS